MLLSIVIPTLNEEDHIGHLLSLVARDTNKVEIIVVDGGSNDGTEDQVANYPDVRFINAPRSRAIQMNRGASVANGSVLYFVHADTRPPKSFYWDILEALDQGAELGCYRFKFDRSSWLMKINDFATRFDRTWTRGGDQSLFITRRLFDKIGGYDESYVIMEEYDLLRAARRLKANFKIIPKEIIVSARKYENNSYLRVQVANFVVFAMFSLGISSSTLLKTYHRLLNYRA